METQGWQDPTLTRQMNSATVLRALHGAAPTTISDLAAMVGLSRRTTNEIMLELVARGWVKPVATPSEFSAIGRPAQWFAFHERAGFVLALDIENDRVLAAVADLQGTIIGSASAPLDPGSSAASVQRLCEAAAADALRNAEADLAAVLMVGVSCTGIIDRDGTVTLSNFLPGLSGFDLKSALEQAFGCPVTIENDCRAALAAELWRGAASGSVVYVAARDVLGCAYSVGGSVFRGEHGASAEMGLLEAFGWRDAQKLLRTESAEASGVAEALALGIAALVVAVDPSSVVVAWHSFERSEQLADALKPLLGSLCARSVPTRAATIHENAGLLGAIRIALDAVEAALFTASDHRLSSVVEISPSVTLESIEPANRSAARV